MAYFAAVDTKDPESFSVYDGNLENKVLIVTDIKKEIFPRLIAESIASFLNGNGMTLIVDLKTTPTYWYHGAGFEVRTRKDPFGGPKTESAGSESTSFTASITPEYQERLKEAFPKEFFSDLCGAIEMPPYQPTKKRDRKNPAPA